MDKTINKKIISILLMLVMVVIGILTPISIKAASIKISDKTLSMTVEDKYQLKLLNTKTRPKWTSADESIATVNKWGTITAKAVGKVKITATIKTMKWTCTVDILDKIDLKVKILNLESDDYQNGDVIIEFTNNAEKDLYLYERGYVNYTNPKTEITNNAAVAMEHGNEGYLISKDNTSIIVYNEKYSNDRFINNETTTFKFSIIYNDIKYIGESDSEGNITFIKWTSRYLF